MMSSDTAVCMPFIALVDDVRRSTPRPPRSSLPKLFDLLLRVNAPTGLAQEAARRRETRNFMADVGAVGG